jgi:hypothetical protein
MQLEQDRRVAPANRWRLPAYGYIPAQMQGQFLIANLELEFKLNVPESATYNFLIANKMRFCNPEIFASPRIFSSRQPRASSL